MTNKHKTEWKAVAARVTGVLVILVGILLAAGLCNATPPDNSVPSIFDPHSTPAESIDHLSYVVLTIAGVIFLVVFTLLTYAVVKFRRRAGDVLREPAQVYGSTQIELAWTIIPILIVVVLFLAKPRVIHAIQDAPKRATSVEPTGILAPLSWDVRSPALRHVRTTTRH